MDGYIIATALWGGVPVIACALPHCADRAIRGSRAPASMHVGALLIPQGFGILGAVFPRGHIGTLHRTDHI